MLYNTQVIISASPDGTTNLDEGEIVTLPSKTGCEGGQILGGSGIWPQSFEAFSETSVASSEAGVRYIFFGLPGGLP